MNRYAVFFEENEEEKKRKTNERDTPGFNKMVISTPFTHRAQSATNTETNYPPTNNNNLNIKGGNKNGNLTQSENLSLRNSNAYKKKWVLSQMIRMQMNIMYCKAVMLNTDCDGLTKEEYLELISEKLLDFQDKIERKSEERKERKNKSKIRKKHPKSTIKVPEEQIIIEMAAENPKKHGHLETQTCPICYEENPKNYLSMIPGCNHSFCKVCLAAYFHDRIISSNLEEVKCPQEDCMVKLFENDLRLLLSDSMFKKYQEFKEKYRLRRDPNIRWCSKAGCDGYMVINSIFTQVVKCTKCGYETCTNCRGPWHPNQTCEQIIDSELKNYESQVPVQKCPNCVCRIEKNGGCNHIVCTNCYQEFCWLCRKVYTLNHYKWWNFCGCPGRQFLDEEERQSMKIICLLWCEDFLTALWFFIRFIGELLFNIIFGFPIYVLACLVAPISIYNEMNSDKELECWEEMLIYPALFLVGIISFPFLFIIGLWILIKRLLYDEEISLFSMFYEEL